MKTFLLLRRLLRVACLLVAAAPLAHAQSDHLNLEGNFGTRLEDAYATAFRNREAQTAVFYERSRDGQNLTRLLPTLEFGPLRNTQLSVAVPLRYGNGDRTSSANIRLDGLYNFNTEGVFIPALAVAAEADVPTGRDSEGLDYAARFIATKSLFNRLHRLHLNAVYHRNSQATTYREGPRLMTERDERWVLLVGYSGRIAPQAVIVVDFVREQLEFTGEYGSSLEVGLRRQMNPRLVLSVGGVAGLGQDEDKYRANFGFQHAF